MQDGLAAVGRCPYFARSELVKLDPDAEVRLRGTDDVVEPTCRCHRPEEAGPDAGPPTACPDGWNSRKLLPGNKTPLKCPIADCEFMMTAGPGA